MSSILPLTQDINTVPLGYNTVHLYELLFLFRHSLIPKLNIFSPENCPYNTNVFLNATPPPCPLSKKEIIVHKYSKRTYVKIALYQVFIPNGSVHCCIHLCSSYENLSSSCCCQNHNSQMRLWWPPP